MDLGKTTMKIKEVIEKILAYHPDLGPDYDGCDNVKCGNIEDECTGIVTALVPTVNVIRKAIELKANLIIVHEPTFYTSKDEGGWFYDFKNEVYEEKRKLLDDNHICIYRDHDHLHTHRPDGIFTGVMKYLGYEDSHELIDDPPFATYIINFEEKTLKQFCEEICSKVGLNGCRYIGDPDMKIKNAAFVGHLYPNGDMEKEYSVETIKVFDYADVILPGESIDWTLLSYTRDANQLGKKKAIVMFGHFNMEEFGARYMKDWLPELIGNEVPVTYVESEDMYKYFERS